MAILNRFDMFEISGKCQLQKIVVYFPYLSNKVG